MKKKNNNIIIIILIVIIGILLAVILNMPSKDDKQLYACRKVNDFNEHIFDEISHKYEGSHEYLDFDYYDYYLYVMDEFCTYIDDEIPRLYTCEMDEDKLYYYDLKAIFDSIDENMPLSKEGYGVQSELLCEDVLFKDTSIYKLINSNQEIIPIPSAYRSIINMNIENDNVESYKFYDLQSEDNLDGLALVSMDLIDLDEAYVISFEYRYAYELEGEHKEKIYPAYGYILK